MAQRQPGESVSHTYTAAGIYSAELTVTDNDGKSSSETVQISVYDPAATASCNTSGLLAEYWLGINGNALSSLYDNALYPSQPSGSLIATDFEASLNQEDYGLRMRGYIVPPFTGNYRFWIASDDQGALLLSTDINPANATEIASVPDWTGNQEWDKFTEQRSARVSLVARRALLHRSVDERRVWR